MQTLDSIGNPSTIWQTVVSSVAPREVSCLVELGRCRYSPQFVEGPRDLLQRTLSCHRLLPERLVSRRLLEISFELLSSPPNQSGPNIEDCTFYLERPTKRSPYAYSLDFGRA